MKVYNTLTRKKEELEPMKPGKINMFVCGPTVNGSPHLGHAKTFIQFDFIVKYLRYKGYDVFYLQNITDIDDKIIKKAAEENISWLDVASGYEKEYREMMEALGVDSVTKYANATEHIDEIISQVKKLMEKEYAYETSDGIYYDVSKFKDYGKLSGRTELEEEDSVSRIDEGIDKRNWQDFCLWKFSEPGEPVWEADIGAGRPGWHIEDTAITEKYFGPQYDIHGGAEDLIFPHHEAEISQMEALSGKSPLVKYWLHTAFLNLQSKKMSKSKGNFMTINEALETYDYRVLRLLFISTHYRTPLDFRKDVLKSTQNTLEKIDDFIFNINPDLEDTQNENIIDRYRTLIIQSLDDNFDTPKALANFFDFTREINASGSLGKNVKEFLEELNTFFGFFKLEFNLDEEEINDLVDKRDTLREQKKFEEADKIREQLLEKGIKIYDTSQGTKWRRV